MRIPITSQLAALVLVMAAWSAWQAPAEATTRDHAVAEPAAGLEAVEIIVENAHLGGARAFVDACGITEVREGRVRLPASLFDAPWRGCEAVATRVDGDFVATSEPVRVTGRSRIDLVLPPYRIGGIGVGLEERDGRVYVAEILPRGSAREAGIRVGDWVVSGDGVDFSTAKEMQAVVLGPEGTTVRVDVFRRTGAEWTRLSSDLERRAKVE